MKGTEEWTMRASCLLAGGTGLLYGYLKYFNQVQGEFGREPHALQAPLQHLHVLVAPLFVLALGMVLRGHALGMLRQGTGRGRASGLGLALLSAPMVLGGYGLQVVTSSAARVALAWVHGVASCLFIGVYLAHWLVAFRLRVQRRSAPFSFGTGAVTARR
jgi:hypothetical protein